jgi:hypothetical protein
VWVAGFPGNAKPLRRAARHDGFFPANLAHLRQDTAAPYDFAAGLPPGTDPGPYAKGAPPGGWSGSRGTRCRWTVAQRASRRPGGSLSHE